MRHVRLAWVVGSVVTVVAGCSPDNTGAVLFHLEQRTEVVDAPTTYSSSQAAVSLTADGFVHLTATSNLGVLMLTFFGPVTEGATIALPQDSFRFVVGAAEWSNESGASVVVLSANPVIVSFVGIPMRARAGTATGSFVIQGGGTFLEP